MKITVLTPFGVYSNYKLLTSHPGFQTVYSEVQPLDSEWLKYLTRKMNYDQAVELYNHYLIWLRVLQTSNPEAILDNNTTPNQPYGILAQLLQAPSKLLIQPDMVLYGKYDDLCYLYKPVSNVAVSQDRGPTYNFPLYQSFSPYGGYAYYITPTGAERLIEMIMTNPKSLDKMINQLAKNGTVLTYNPSIINGPEHRYECRSPSVPVRSGWVTFIWYLILFLLIIIIIGILVYLMIVKLAFRPGKEIPIKYIGPEASVTVLSSHEPTGSEGVIYYGSTRTSLMTNY